MSINTGQLGIAEWAFHGLYYIYIYIFYRRKFRSQTSDNMDRWKSRGVKSQGGEEKKWDDQRRERERRKKMQVREKVGKSRFTVFFQWFVTQAGRKVGSLKRRVRSQPARWEMKSCTLLWREAHFQVTMYKTHKFSDHFWKFRCRKIAHSCGAKHISKSQCTKHTILRPLLEAQMSKKCTPLWREAHFHVIMYKTHHSQTIFGSSDVEKLHTVVARSTFPTENLQTTPTSDHFWKLRCRKSARCCGAKHISKSQCTKHTILRPLLEVQMSKKCTPLWRKAHFQVIMYKTHNSQTTFGSSDVEKVHAVVARSTFPSQNAQKHLSSEALLDVEMSKKCTPLWHEAHVQRKIYKPHQRRTTFGSSDVERVHAVVARSTFPSQQCEKLTGPDHFLTFRCRFAWQAQGIVHLVKK